MTESASIGVDVPAERLGTSRGAPLKTLPEARSRLRDELGAAGLGPDRWQQRRPSGGDPSYSAGAPLRLLKCRPHRLSCGNR